MLIKKEIILPEHTELREFLEFLLKHDPNERPSAEEALKHKFFGINYGDAVAKKESIGNLKESTSVSMGRNRGEVLQKFSETK